MMDGDFASLRIDGGMFSPEFLQRVADASPELDGCSPADYSSAEEGVNNLRDHLNYLWNRSIAVWDRFGPSGDEELPAARVKGFIQRLMRDIGLELTSLPKHNSSRERPQLAYDLGGSLWHVVASEVHLDQRSESIGTRRTSPHNLVQGELTSSEHHGWGLLTNGRQVRILRKTNRPSIQEALEFDIETMFNDRLYPDFCLFAMMVHGTRWSRNKDAPMDCWLETWYKASKEEGLSVLEDLRGCVQQAANAFGTGLVRFQAGNQHLRDRLRSEAGLANELQREIMRYMYKLIFLFVMEDRNLLLRGNGEDLTPELETARERYMLGYSTQRHRSVVATTKGDEHHNFFEEVKLVIGFLYQGEERLALPALGSYLFSNQSTEIIDGCTLLNTDFMKTLYHLCTFKKKDGPRQRVHWKTLRETELGSVYESLLELRPSIDLDNGTFTLVSEAGNDRKSSGSYYTPAELVDHLITTTIDPLLDEAKKKAKKDAESPEEYPRLAQEAILKLTVCDPACGSGHFLVAALERIAMELARIETGEHHPGISFIRKWKRLASSRCIYGVDLNPLAVELCKVAIWMDTYDGTNPLSFLDGHIRHGNSLLGQRLEKMGLIPDDAIPKAWADQRKEHRKFNREQIKKATKDAEERLKKLQREYGERKKRSKQSGLGAFIEIPDDGRTDQELKQEIDQLKEAIEQKEAQKLLPPEIVWSTVDLPCVIADIAAQQAEVTLMGEGSLEQIEQKATQLQRLNTDERSNWAKEVLDASMAMWWWPEPDIDEHKQMMADPPVPLASFELNRYATWLAYQYGIEDDVLSNRATATHNFSNDETRFRLIRAHTERIADEQSFFHWELEFAEVFFSEDEGDFMPGITAMIGNPPWAKPRIEDKEWWSQYPEIAAAKTATRKKMIEELRQTEPHTVARYESDVSENEKLRTYLGSDAYPLCGHGDLNLYGIFAELFANVARNTGIITQTNLVTDTTTHRWFKEMVNSRRISTITDFVNKRPYFRGIADNTRFSIINLSTEYSKLSITANNTTVEEAMQKDAYIIDAKLVEKVNGEAYTCPMFSSKIEFDFVINLIENGARFGDDTSGWNAQYGTMVHMSGGSEYFRNINQLIEIGLTCSDKDSLWFNSQGELRYIPMYEAKLFDAFNPKHGDFRPVPSEKKFGVKAQPARPEPSELDDANWSPHPRYWVPVTLRDDWLQKRADVAPGLGRVATRRICRGLVESRTLKAAVLPYDAAMGDSANYWLSPSDDEEYPWVLTSVLNSLVLDFQARMKLTGMNLSKYLQEQLFVPTPDKLSNTHVSIDGSHYDTAWNQLLGISRSLHREWVHLNHPLGAPPAWLSNEENPMAPLDVIVAKIMGLNEEKFSWLLDQFPIWERQLGEQLFRKDRMSWFKRIEIIRSQKDAEKINVDRLITGYEGLHVEFKETLKEVRGGGTSKEVNNSFIKAVIGMANNEGGHVLVGVKEENGKGRPVGFDTKFMDDHDKAQKAATEMIQAKSAYAATLIRPKVHTYNDTKVLVIEVKPAGKPIYCDLGQGEQYFLRLAGSVPKPLTGNDLETHLASRFGDF